VLKFVEKVSKASVEPRPGAVSNKANVGVKKIMVAPSGIVPSQTAEAAKEGKVCLHNQGFAVEKVYSRSLAKKGSDGPSSCRCDT
jgi:hypothetical protein